MIFESLASEKNYGLSKNKRFEGLKTFYYKKEYVCNRSSRTREIAIMQHLLSLFWLKNICEI